MALEGVDIAAEDRIALLNRCDGQRRSMTESEEVVDDLEGLTGERTLLEALFAERLDRQTDRAVRPDGRSRGPGRQAGAGGHVEHPLPGGVGGLGGDVDRRGR